MNDVIIYSKEQNISFNVIKVTLKNIPVLVPEKLSIYQKYIILFLQSGVNAYSKNNLIEKLSDSLNIKLSFVEEFINILNDFKYLKHDEEKEFYYLSDNYKILNDSLDVSIMNANVGCRYADFYDLYYIDELDIWVNKSFFNNKLFKLRKVTDKNDSIFNYVSNHLDENEVRIKEFIVEDFSKNNYILNDDFRYSLDNTYESYKLDIKTTFVYSYYDDRAVCEDIKYDISDIPEDIFKSKCSLFYEDFDIPKFIKYKEEYYDKFNENDLKIDEIDEKYDSNVQESNDIKEKMSNDKFIELLDENDDSSLDKINSLEDENKQLLDDRNSLIKEQQNVLLSGKGKIDNLVFETIKKYDSTTKFGRKVIKICNQLDYICEASNYDSFDELEDGMLMIRDLYKQTLKVLFDYIFNKQSISLGYYFGIENVNEVEKKLKSLKVSVSTLNNLRFFYNISNPYGHLNDNHIGKDNKKVISEFINLSKEERKLIILSTVKLFNEIELNKNDLINLEKKYKSI